MVFRPCSAKYYPTQYMVFNGWLEMDWVIVSTNKKVKWIGRPDFTKLTMEFGQKDKMLFFQPTSLVALIFLNFFDIAIVTVNINYFGNSTSDVENHCCCIERYVQQKLHLYLFIEQEWIHTDNATCIATWRVKNSPTIQRNCKDKTSFLKREKSNWNMCTSARTYISSERFLVSKLVK